jgi:hexulose-6-phosphate isomerase
VEEGGLAMIKTINYWSFQGGLAATRPLKSAMQEAKDKGFEGIELCLALTGELTPKTTRRQCEQMLKDADAIGISIASMCTGVYWDVSLTDDSAAVRKRARAITEAYLERAAWLKVDAVLVVPGAVDVFFKPDAPVVPYRAVWERSQEQLKALAKKAEHLKVVLAVENVWNRFLLSPVEMAYFVDSVGSDYVGCYFDVGNVLPFGYPQDWIRTLGPRIKRIHMKDFKRAVGNFNGFCDLTEGDVPWAEVMRALKAIGYKGPVTAEMMPYRPTLLDLTSTAMDWILSL